MKKLIITDSRGEFELQPQSSIFPSVLADELDQLQIPGLRAAAIQDDSSQISVDPVFFKAPFLSVCTHFVQNEITGGNHYSLHSDYPGVRINLQPGARIMFTNGITIEDRRQ